MREAFDDDISDDDSVESAASSPDLEENAFEDDGLVFRWISEDHEEELCDESVDDQLKCPPL